MISSTEPQRRISKGKIRRLFEDRGYGFIKADNGETIFFHASSLQGAEMGSLSLNQSVEFEIEEGPRGIRPVRVVPTVEVSRP
jgi:CspA family cold shock protein